MNNLIIVIHPSEIIRKGLAVVIRGFFVNEVLLLENSKALKSYLKMKNYSIIAICDQLDLSKNELILKLQDNNTIKFMHLSDYNNSTQTLPLPWENRISLNSTAPEIEKLISDCWKSFDKNPRQPENDELTIREKEVLRLVALGYSNKIIADKLFISIHTVISHRKNISEKTGIKSISGLTVYAILNNLIDTKTINPQDLI